MRSAAPVIVHNADELAASLREAAALAQGQAYDAQGRLAQPGGHRLADLQQRLEAWADGLEHTSGWVQPVEGATCDES